MTSRSNWKKYPREVINAWNRASYHRRKALKAKQPNLGRAFRHLATARAPQ